MLPNSTLTIGLSWRNLTAALGASAEKWGAIVPKRWGVLFLGTVKDSKDEQKPSRDPSISALDGIVVLDGNWRQAKALWWRNPWLLKLRRIVLSPTEPSKYGALRREPRRESLSTLEAIALALEQEAGESEAAKALRGLFALFLERAAVTLPHLRSRSQHSGRGHRFRTKRRAPRHAP
jgi:DTW domain-containing protein YfiP